MLETIPMTDGMINGVMLVEHEGGREYVSDLESALLDYKKDPSDNNASRICFASEGYINLLSDHTSKEDEILFEKLRELRKKLADEQGYPAYIILSDKILHILATIKPKTIDEFGTINGIGDFKKDKYGATFVALILRHESQ